MSSLDSFLLLELPMSSVTDLDCHSSSPVMHTFQSQCVLTLRDNVNIHTVRREAQRCQRGTWQEWTCRVLQKVLERLNNEGGNDTRYASRLCTDQSQLDAGSESESRAHLAEWRRVELRAPAAPCCQHWQMFRLRRLAKSNDQISLDVVAPRHWLGKARQSPSGPAV